MLHTKLMKIGPLVPEKKIFEVVLPHGRGSHLGHVTNIIFIDFHFLVSKCIHTNGLEVSERSKLYNHRRFLEA